MVCPRCNNVCDDNSRSCKRCGLVFNIDNGDDNDATEVIGFGNNINMNNSFDDNCKTEVLTENGVNIKDNTPKPKDSSNNNPKKSKSPIATILLGAVGVIIVVLLILVVLFL